jgi:transcriptional regulator with XRE-family HTH domain
MSGFRSEPRVRLVEARHACGWSQREVAERVGTTFVNVSRWERGVTHPGSYYRRRLCALYRKTEEELGLATPLDAFAEAGSTASAPVQLPMARDPSMPQPPDLPLLGREQVFGEVIERLCAGNSVTALCGLPGIGKTALATRAVSDPQVVARFREGVLWASLGPAPDLPTILARWGEVLGVRSPAPVDESRVGGWMVALRRKIGERRMLFILDDVWDCGHALDCFVGGSACASLVLTRAPAVAVCAVPGVDGLPIKLAELDDEVSLALLHSLAPELQNISLPSSSSASCA